MTHDDYMSRLASLSDSPADTRAVLEHVGDCSVCARDQRFVDGRIGALDSSQPGWVEPVARWAAVAAMIALLVLGLRRSSTSEAAVASEVRYRVVGNASGVVAYTPGGIVTGTIHKPGSRRQR